MRNLIINKETGELTCPMCGEMVKKLNFEISKEKAEQGEYDIKKGDYVMFDVLGGEDTEHYFCPDCGYEFKDEEVEQIINC